MQDMAHEEQETHTMNATKTVTLDALIDRQRGRVAVLKDTKLALRNYLRDVMTTPEVCELLQGNRAQIHGICVQECNKFFDDLIYAAGLALDEFGQIAEQYSTITTNPEEPAH